ncbi:hypothetical protein [Microvirga antarctica]|nr:hypothetical protein [Microvirga antarctica]
MATLHSRPGRGGGRRFAWFVAIYGASLIVFAALVYGLRAIIPH